VQRLSTLCYFATPRAGSEASRLPGTLRSRRQKGRRVGVATTKYVMARRRMHCME